MNTNTSDQRGHILYFNFNRSDMIDFTHNMKEIGINMEEFLKQYIIEQNPNISEEWANFEYSENTDTGKYGFIDKVAVMAAIDSNKCDWVYIAIGVQRNRNNPFEIKGYFHFHQGENDDIGSVLKRTFEEIKYLNPVFEEFK